MPDEIDEGRAELEAAFDKIEAESPEDDVDAPVAEESAVAEVAEVAAKPVAEDPPTDMPAGVKAHWATFSPEARAAVVAAQRERDQKLSVQGRTISAMTPVMESLQAVAKDIPGFSGRKPAEIAQEIGILARASVALSQRPVETVLQMAKARGFTDKLREALGVAPQPGQPSPPDTRREMDAMRAEIKRLSDPSNVQKTVSQMFAEKEVLGIVNGFAAAPERAELWKAAEPLVMRMIPVVQETLGPNASPQDVLARAYDMAVHANPDLRAKVMAAAKAPVTDDPDRTAAQRAAKSINVTSRPGEPKPIPVRDELSVAYDRLVRM